ncbi:MAG: trypsin-like peptidase domain-containing protein, partial [Dehalococcoidia bacterium]|nr:trypsin-like peptidase domain-containing protein [Dehalococcoidia bacterium]
MRKITLALAVALVALTLVGCSIGIPSFPGSSNDKTVAATTPTPLQQGWTPPPVSTGTRLPDIADVVPLITPFVVSIQTEAIGYDVFLRAYPEQGAGTGIIIDSNGYILTNNHVVEGATKVTVNLADGTAFDAVDVRSDPQTDIAVIKVNATGLPAARIGDSGKLRVGEWVIAVGNALALDGGPTVTKGIVSYLG